MFRISRVAHGATALFLLSAAGNAQCGLDWQPGAGAAGPNGSVLALQLAANGNVIAAGSFGYADHAKTAGIARYDGTTWQPFGAGLLGQVYDVIERANGEVIAGGQFGVPGSPGLLNLARWDGVAWGPIGGSADGRVYSLLELPGGDVIAAGFFATIGGVSANHIARWNGSTWSALGTGVSGTVYTIAVLPNGDLLAGGDLFSGSQQFGLTRWNGSVWTPVAGSQRGVYSLAVQPNGDVFAGGVMDYTLPTGPTVYEYLVHWNGTQVTPIATPFTNGLALALLPNGNLLAATNAVASGGASVAEWNGTTWTPRAAGAPPTASALAVGANGRVLVGALTGDPGFARFGAVREWNGTQWQPLGDPVPPQVLALQRGAHGDVFAGGNFTSFQGVAANHLARFANGAWSAVGGGLDGKVTALAAAANGDLLVGGEFTLAGGGPANRVARWNGVAWSSLGAGLAAAPTSLATVPNGDVFALVGSSAPQLFRFDGVAWTLLAPPPFAPLGAQPRLLGLPDGTLLVSGYFASVIRYQAGAFTTLAVPHAGTTSAMVLDPQGRLVVSCGVYIARFDGTTWTLIADSTPTLPGMSGGLSRALACLANGDVVTVGTYTVQGQQVGIWRFDGTWWAIVDGGIQAGTPDCIAAADSGDLFVAGEFVGAGNEISVRFVHARPTCSAAVSSFGTGCTGIAGPLGLQANGLPWAGAVFRATASGLAAPLAVRVIGQPVAALPLPFGAPGCSVFEDSILLDVLSAPGGQADAGFSIPRDPSLAGLPFRMQVIGLELNATGDLVRLTSSNALALTIGVL